MGEQPPKWLRSHGSINGCPVSWTPDSGAEISAIDPDHPAARSLPWEPNTDALSSADGRSLDCRGIYTSLIEIAPQVHRLVRLFAVSGLSPPAILGTDVLYSNSPMKWFRVGNRHFYQLGTDQFEVFPPDPADVSGYHHGLRLVKTDTAVDQSTIRFFNRQEGGVVRPKLGEAQVTVPDTLTPSQIEIFRNLLVSFRDCFANMDDEIGYTQSAEYRIVTSSAVPVISGKLRNARQPRQAVAEMRKEVQKMLHNGVVRPSTSPWNSPVLLIRKKTGEWRFCIDFRDLNLITVEDGGELPGLMESLERLAGSSIFTCLDLASGYWQLPLELEARVKTAFSVGGDHYEFTVLPFGVRNGPAAFARLMRRVLGDLIDKGEPIAVFFDDITIGGKDTHEHHRLLTAVFERLQQHKLVVKSKKVLLARSEVRTLGFRVDAKGLHPDEDKILAIHDFPPPSNPSQVRGFVGLLTFYGFFVPGLQTLLSPLHKVCNVLPSKFEWSPSLQSVFVEAKSRFTTALLLALPDFKIQFRVTTDASDHGIGACLSQLDDNGHERPLAFFSAALSETEQKWSTRDRELWAFVAACRKWRHYLLGPSFVWLTDHKPLLHQERVPVARVARWLEELLEFDYQAEYVAGESNVAADALSRVFPYTSQSRLVLGALTSQTFVRPEDRPALIADFHDRRGHRGVDVVYESLRSHYYWPTLRRDVVKYIRQCLVCQRASTSGGSDPPLEVTSTPVAPWEDVAVDLLETQDGYLVTIIDLFSRYVEGSYVATKDAIGVADSISRNLFDRHGTPSSILSDLGTEFNGLQEFSIALGFDWKRISRANPQSNGTVERVHRTLLATLRRVRQEDSQLSGDALLCRVLFLYNTTPHSATGFSPYYLLYSRDPFFPEEIVDQKPKGRVDSKAGLARWAAQRAKLMAESHRFALNHTSAAKHSRVLRTAGRRDRAPTINLGQHVLIRNLMAKKDEPRWLGPYEVIQVRQGNVFRLKNLANFRDRRVLSARHIKPVKSDMRHDSQANGRLPSDTYLPEGD